jgi:hypothetical protein
MRVKVLSAAALSVSCGAAVAHAPAPAPALAPPSASALAPAPAPVPAPDLAALLCGDRAPCVVRRERVAGAGLRVVSIDLGVRDAAGDEHAPLLEPPGPDIEETATTDTILPFAVHTRCRQLEYWLVGDHATQLLLSTCNDGYGASGVGEDVIEVHDGRLARDIQGGSAWRWGTRTEIALAPLRALRTSWSNHWSVGPNIDEGEVDWEKFEGSAGWFSPICDANGEPPNGGEWDYEARYAYRMLPAVALDDAFRASGWRTAALGACALDLDGTGERAFLLSGARGQRADASLRVVASSKGELFVEIRDATPTGATARWAIDDHLQIWTASEELSYSQHCLPQNRAAPKQWVVRVADGKIFAGAGSPRASDLVVTREAAPGLTRLRIELPSDARAVTIAYADAERGKVKRVFASSRLVRGAPETVGHLLAVSEATASCRVERGSLEVVPVTGARDPETAYLGQD